MYAVVGKRNSSDTLYIFIWCAYRRVSSSEKSLVSRNYSYSRIYLPTVEKEQKIITALGRISAEKYLNQSNRVPITRWKGNSIDSGFRWLSRTPRLPSRARTGCSEIGVEIQRACFSRDVSRRDIIPGTRRTGEKSTDTPARGLESIKKLRLSQQRSRAVADAAALGAHPMDASTAALFAYTCRERTYAAC